MYVQCVYLKDIHVYVTHKKELKNIGLHRLGGNSISLYQPKWTFVNTCVVYPQRAVNAVLTTPPSAAFIISVKYSLATNMNGNDHPVAPSLSKHQLNCSQRNGICGIYICVYKTKKNTSTRFHRWQTFLEHSVAHDCFALTFYVCNGRFKLPPFSVLDISVSEYYPKIDEQIQKCFHVYT